MDRKTQKTSFSKDDMLAQLKTMQTLIEELEEAHRYEKAALVSDQSFSLIMIIEARFPGTFAS